MKLKRRFLLLFCAIFVCAGASAQKVALKTNLLYDATATVNLGIEAGLSRHLTVDVSGNYIPWTIKGHRWKHWMAQPELRVWTCERFSGSFFAVHLVGGQYNFGNIDTKAHFIATDFSPLADHRVDGWGIGAGMAYGYAFTLGKHWNLELEVGVGYIYTRNDVFDGIETNVKIESGKLHEYIGPTKAAFNLVYLF